MKTLKEINWKSFFEQAIIIIASAGLTGLVDSLPILQELASQHLDPSVVGPIFALIGLFLRKTVQGVTARMQKEKK